MGENKNRNWSESQKPESASKGGKRPNEERERDRASEMDQSHEGQSRGNRNPFRNDRERASQAGREGGGR
jgi:general stress protein YciG